MKFDCGLQLDHTKCLKELKRENGRLEINAVVLIRRNRHCRQIASDARQHLRQQPSKTKKQAGIAPTLHAIDASAVASECGSPLLNDGVPVRGVHNAIDRAEVVVLVERVVDVIAGEKRQLTSHSFRQCGLTRSFLPATAARLPRNLLRKSARGSPAR